MDRVAFLGLGAMGAPMARRIRSHDHPLNVFDVVTGRADALADAGAVSCGSPAEAARDVDVLVVMVATADQAESALFGPGGAAEGLDERAAVVLMSTLGPAAARALAARLAERGVRTLDAPVSGGVARAGSGELLVMAGGDPALFERLRPLLETMGSRVLRCGAVVGDGQSVKLVNQLLCGVHIAVAAEAMAYAAALGLDARSVYEVVRHGAANSFALEDRAERMLQGDFDPPRSAVSIFVKDMGLVLDAAHGQGCATPLGAVAQQLYAIAAGTGMSSLDDSSLVRLYEQWAGGVRVSAPR